MYDPQIGPEPDLTSTIPGMHIWGWMTPIELEWLAAQAATMGSVTEIGSLHGRSAFGLLTACDGPVYCIDPWDDPEAKCYGSFMGACGHFKNVRPVRGRSPQVTGSLPDVDMTFIDGAHAYESVLADIAAWLPKTRRLLCGHDYYDDPATAGYPGVQQAVDLVFGDRVRVAPGTSIWSVDVGSDRTVGPDVPVGRVQVVDEYGRTSVFDLAWP